MLLSLKMCEEQPLLPIQIIHFEPVTRQTVEYRNRNELSVDYKGPEFFDLGYFYSIYMPLE
jgi:hypothetical protein